MTILNLVNTSNDKIVKKSRFESDDRIVQDIARIQPGN